MEKIDEIYLNTAVIDTRGRITEESIKKAMQEYADWSVKKCNLHNVSNNEVAVCDHKLPNHAPVKLVKCPICGDWREQTDC